MSVLLQAIEGARARREGLRSGALQRADNAMQIAACELGMTLKEKIRACLHGEKLDALCDHCLAAAIGETGPLAVCRIGSTVWLVG